MSEQKRIGTRYPEIMQLLQAPISPDEIEWRPGSTNADKTRALALPYLQSRTVMDRLDLVVGPENWQDAYKETPLAGSGVAGVQAGIAIWFADRELWVWKWDAASPTDIEPVKGAYSDALKRVAVKWGIGRQLYSLPAIWVKCEPAGRSVRLAEDPLAQLRQKAPWYWEAYYEARELFAHLYAQQKQELAQGQASEAQSGGKEEALASAPAPAPQQRQAPAPQADHPGAAPAPEIVTELIDRLRSVKLAVLESADRKKEDPQTAIERFERFVNETAEVELIGKGILRKQNLTVAACDRLMPWLADQLTRARVAAQSRARDNAAGREHAAA